MNEQAFYRVSVKALIYDAEGGLLLAREGDQWELLGGGLDHGEDPRDCLAREITEETGLKVKRAAANPRYFVPAPKPDKDFHVANVAYEVEIESLQDFIPSPECQELRYFSLAEMHDLKLFFNVQKLLEQIEIGQ